MEDKVRFEHNGKTYSMTEEEIDAAYQFRRRQYLEEDARNQLYAYRDAISLPSWSEEESNERFVESEGVSFDRALQMIPAIADLFEDEYDCNNDENNQWMNAIASVIGDEIRRMEDKNSDCN